MRAVLAEAGADPERVRPSRPPSSTRLGPAPRPAYSVLDNMALRLSGLPALPDWQDGLARLVPAAPAAQTARGMSHSGGGHGEAAHRWPSSAPATWACRRRPRWPTSATTSCWPSATRPGCRRCVRAACRSWRPGSTSWWPRAWRPGTSPSPTRRSRRWPGRSSCSCACPRPRAPTARPTCPTSRRRPRRSRPHLEPGAIVVNKSTVPVGSANMVEQVIGRPDISVVSNPEFLREGTAVLDSLNPDRIVVGADDAQAAAKVGELFASTRAPLIVTDATTSETIKYTSNAFLATKLSFVNALAGLCEEVGADARDVLLGLGYDKRIGFEFLRPGPGWGGSCLPKDTRALLHIAGEAGYDFSLLAGAIASNDEQLSRVVAKVETACGGSVDGATVAVWGLTFKANTDDRRDSPSLQIAHRLAGLGATVQAFDPTVDAEADVPDLHGLQLRADPYDGGGRGPGAGRAHRVGRVPLARLLPRARRHGRAQHRRRPQPARSGRRAPHGLPGTSGSGASEPSRGGRRRRLPGLAPVRPPDRAGRHRRLPRRPLDRVAGRTWPTCSGHDRFSLIVTNVSEKVELADGVHGRRGVQPGLAGVAAGVPRPALRHAGRGQRGHPPAARAGPGARRAVPDGEHQRDLRRSRGASPGGVATGATSTRPGRAASTTRPSGSPRA